MADCTKSKGSWINLTQKTGRTVRQKVTETRSSNSWAKVGKKKLRVSGPRCNAFATDHMEYVRAVVKRFLRNGLRHCRIHRCAGIVPPRFDAQVIGGEACIA